MGSDNSRYAMLELFYPVFWHGAQNLPTANGLLSRRRTSSFARGYVRLISHLVDGLASCRFLTLLFFTTSVVSFLDGRNELTEPSSFVSFIAR
jgi:hypothetical protein